MRRWLAGRFEPRRRGREERLPDALAPHPSRLIRAGPVELAYSGPEVADAEVLCLLDGRLDNGEWLRSQLGLAGPEAPDEELLLAAAFRRWGAELLPRLRGDFVLFLWDRERGRGLLARDQLGIRPAFLHGGPDAPLRFAGEICHLLALLPSRPGPDRASLAHWIAASTRPGPQTLLDGVRRLGPGSAVLLSETGARERRYWAPRFEGASELSPPQLAEAVRERLGRAVRRRAAEGPAAVLMSGGLDSSAVAALAASEVEEEPIVCSASFPEHPATDESALIAELRERLSLRGPSATVRAGGLIAGMLAHLRAWQMPPLGWGDFWAEPLIEAAARKGATTVLGGDGGDEVFGPRSYLLADRLRGGRPLRAWALAGSLPGAGPHLGRRQVAGAFWRLAVLGAVPEPLQRPLAGRGIGREAPAWMLPETRRSLAESDDPHAWKRLDGPRWWGHAAHGIADGIEQTGMFEHQRRRAAALGVEAAHPMLDLDLVELCLRQPPEATLDRRFNRPVLRAAMAGVLPDSVRLRPAKAWFDSLIVDCLGAEQGAIRELLSGPGTELGAYVDVDLMRTSLLDRERVRRDEPFRWMWQVWRLLTAECWLRSQSRSVSQILPDATGLGEARVEIAATPRLIPFSSLTNAP